MHNVKHYRITQTFVIALAMLFVAVVGASAQTAQSQSGNDLLDSIAAATGLAGITAQPIVATLRNPTDVASDASGRHFYFLADGHRGKSVFRVTLATGKVRELWSGAPLVAPLGIAVGDDGDAVYVADPGAGRGGVLFALDDEELRPLVVGYHARGVETHGDDIYFTGNNPRTGAPGLFRIGEGGGHVRVVAEGWPFLHPIGVALGRGGDAWVSDETAPGFARVIHVVGGHAVAVTAPLRAGTPPGIAVAQDEKTVLLSGLDAITGTALVYFIDAQSFTIASANNGISGNTGAGGLHRAARNGMIFSWAGTPHGPIYKIMVN